MPDSAPDLETWRALYETFKIDGDDKKAVPRPTTQELDRFETETGIRLPAGYRGYIQVFGPGDLAVGSGKKLREMFIRSPYCPKRSLDLMKAAERNEALKSDPPRGMDEQTRRIVVFAHDGLGDEFGWDPQDITDPSAAEFGVYAWYRGDNVVKISNTFLGFIRFTLDPDARSEHRNNQVYKQDANESDLSTLDKGHKRVFQRPNRP